MNLNVHAPPISVAEEIQTKPLTRKVPAMGDAADMADIERFMRSAEGQQYLRETVELLKGRTIIDVRFSNETHFIATTLLLDNGDTFSVNQPSHDLAVIREGFEEVLEREYFVDFPDRKPMEA